MEGALKKAQQDLAAANRRADNLQIELEGYKCPHTSPQSVSVCLFFSLPCVARYPAVSVTLSASISQHIISTDQGARPPKQGPRLGVQRERGSEGQPAFIQPTVTPVTAVRSCLPEPQRCAHSCPIDADALTSHAGGRSGMSDLVPVTRRRGYNWIQRMRWRPRCAHWCVCIMVYLLVLVRTKVPVLVWCVPRCVYWCESGWLAMRQCVCVGALCVCGTCLCVAYYHLNTTVLTRI